MVSLKEVAAAAGVAVSTASRVLNGVSPTCASPQVRERIWQAARQLGYGPDLNARRLRQGRGEARQPLVAVMATRDGSLEQDPFFSELGRCVEIELCSQGCALGPLLTPAAEPQALANVDGLVVLGRCPQPLPQRLGGISAAVVSISRNPRDYPMDQVVCDGKKAAELAVAHLVSLGHKKIAYIGDCSDEDRYVGYCEALIRRRLPLDYNAIIPTRQTQAEGELAMAKLLTLAACTAVFCANDATALGALSCLRRARPQPPISVIGIDDVEAAGSSQPLLTTVAIPLADLAHAAVVLLLDRLRGGHRTCLRVEAPCRLVRRDSCYPL